MVSAAARKGFFAWLAEQNADVVCIQEIKAKVQLTDSVFYPGVTTVNKKRIGRAAPVPLFLQAAAGQSDYAFGLGNYRY